MLGNESERCPSDSQRQATRDAGSVTEFVLTNFGKGTVHNEYYVHLNWMCNMRLEAFDLYLLVVLLFAASLVGEITMQRVGLPFAILAASCKRPASGNCEDR